MEVTQSRVSSTPRQSVRGACVVWVGPTSWVTWQWAREARFCRAGEVALCKACETARLESSAGSGPLDIPNPTGNFSAHTPACPGVCLHVCVCEWPRDHRQGGLRRCHSTITAETDSSWLMAVRDLLSPSLQGTAWFIGLPGDSPCCQSFHITGSHRRPFLTTGTSHWPAGKTADKYEHRVWLCTQSLFPALSRSLEGRVWRSHFCEPHLP